MITRVNSYAPLGVSLGATITFKKLNNYGYFLHHIKIKIQENEPF